MLSYAVTLLACLILLYNNSTSNNLSPPRSIRRTPRPQVNESLLALEEDISLTCPSDNDVGYSIHLVSKEPLVVYIENFISKEERAHLLDIRWVSFLQVPSSRFFFMGEESHYYDFLDFF